MIKDSFIFIVSSVGALKYKLMSLYRHIPLSSSGWGVCFLFPFLFGFLGSVNADKWDFTLKHHQQVLPEMHNPTDRNNLELATYHLHTSWCKRNDVMFFRCAPTNVKQTATMHTLWSGYAWGVVLADTELIWSITSFFREFFNPVIRVTDVLTSSCTKDKQIRWKSFSFFLLRKDDVHIWNIRETRQLAKNQ